MNIRKNSLRLEGYDYSQSGFYFITICTQDRKQIFGEIKENEMQLNKYGLIATNTWNELHQYYDNIQLDEFIVMPNHIHGIVIINDVGATLAVARKYLHIQKNRAGVNPVPTLAVGNIVGAYKSMVAKQCLEIYKNEHQQMGKLWQRGYYDHIIRDNESFQNIINYIKNNPMNWGKDKLYA
jgi:REP element-mobilizing transposase RayT